MKKVLCTLVVILAIVMVSSVQAGEIGLSSTSSDVEIQPIAGMGMKIPGIEQDIIQANNPPKHSSSHIYRMTDNLTKRSCYVVVFGLSVTEMKCWPAE